MKYSADVFEGVQITYSKCFKTLNKLFSLSFLEVFIISIKSASFTSNFRVPKVLTFQASGAKFKLLLAIMSFFCMRIKK